MAYWQKGTIVSAEPGGRVNVDAEGSDDIRFLSPKFVLNDGSDYGVVGYGLDLVASSEPAPESLWPDASNTGFRSTPGTPVTGDVTSTADGQTISGRDVTAGTIIAAHNSVTAADCEVETTGTYAVQVQAAKTGAVVEYCTLSGAQTGIQGAGTFRRNDISGVENGIVVSGGHDTSILDNYIHDLFQDDPDPHYDGIAAQGGCNNILIQGNWITGTEEATIQGIFVSDEFGAADNIVITENYIGKCSFNIAIGSGVTNVTVTNNVLERGTSGFYNFAAPENVTCSGNISTRGYYIDGDAVPVVGEAAFEPSAAMSGSDANINTGFRVAATLAAVGTEYRVVFKSGSGGTDLRGLAVGKQASGVNATAALQEIEFGGETIAASAIEMTAGTEVVSDWFTPAASFEVGDVMIIGFSMENPGSTALASGNSNATTYFGSASTYADQNPASYTESAGNVFGILRIEAR